MDEGHAGLAAAVAEHCSDDRVFGESVRVHEC